MRRTLGPALLAILLCVLAATLSTRGLEYRDQSVSITSEKGERRFVARGLVVPLWMDHESWNGPVEPGKPQQFARVDIQKGLYAKPGVTTLQATVAGVIFPLILIGIALYWTLFVYRIHRPNIPAAHRPG